jgi:hypothetical protein
MAENRPSRVFSGTTISVQTQFVCCKFGMATEQLLGRMDGCFPFDFFVVFD